MVLGVTRRRTHRQTHKDTHTHTDTHARANTDTHTHTRKHTRACAFERVHVVGLCVRMGVCVRATTVCVYESVSVGMSLNPSASACARGCVRVRVRARVCGSDPCGCLRFMCVFASNFARISVRALVRVCAYPRARACAGVRLCARATGFCRSVGKHLRACVACVCAARLCVYASALCGRCGRTAATCGINSSAGAGRRRVRGCGVVRSAVGVTWTSRTSGAQWAARQGHSTVIDAAGAIYVLGGLGTTNYNDVWVTTDGGARAGLGRVGGRRVHWAGTQRYSGVPRGYLGVLRGY